MLFEAREEDVAPVLEEPDFFADLNLDRVLASMAGGRERYELEAFFYTPLHDAEAVRYRQEVLRDLESHEVLALVTRFAESMTQTREYLQRVASLRYEQQQRAWFVEAVDVYSEAVRSLLRNLGGCDLRSHGLLGLRDYLDEYVSSERFTVLVADWTTVTAALTGVRYRVRIDGPRVTVSRYEGETDYSMEILNTFERFRQGSVSSYLARSDDDVEMNHIEAQILDQVARLFPNEFAARAEFCARHAGFLDATVARFDRQVQFYLAYLQMIRPLREAGLPFCYPEVSTDSIEVAARSTFDISLANKLVADRREVVCNDFILEGPERMFVISGPNNGGKTTFARAFGQLHHLGGLGLLVPGNEARLFLPDRTFTHFEREEDIATLRGKFDEELVRVHEILEHATSNSVIVMNESFNSTTLRDALFVGTSVMRRILELGCLGVYVTFIDEIASLSEATVSMVTEVVADDPAQRTFKVLRRPADGLAYAWAIAEKYGLSYERLMERIE